MLQIKNLHASVNGKAILKGLNLTVKPGEVHVIMGPNGSGKSTTAAVLAGSPAYMVSQGSIEFNGKQINELKPEQRAGEGIFMAFQYPVEVPGVSNINFLKTAVQEIRAYRGQPALEPLEFLTLVKQKQKLVQFSDQLARRALNQGFSGGEKKRNEIFQLSMLNPTLAILDETDSGLDIDALRIVADGVNLLRSSENAFIVITHYQRLLEHIVPDFVHVLYDGRIVKSGNKDLAIELEERGYDWLQSISLHAERAQNQDGDER